MLLNGGLASELSVDESTTGEWESGLYPAVCLRGDYETLRGTIELRVEARSAERGRGLRRECPPPQRLGPGVTPGKILKFETQFGAIWCILARN